MALAKIGYTVAVAVVIAGAFVPVASASAEMPGLRLSRDVVPLVYEPRLSIDPASEVFSGSIAIKVRVDRSVDIVWLNARNLVVRDVRAVIAASSPSATVAGRVVTGRDDLIGLKFDPPLPMGEATLELQYSGAVESVSAIGAFRQQDGGNWYVFTQFEPLDARRVFPSFDQPDFKSIWRLTLVVPQEMRAFANMPVLRERVTASGQREVTFLDTPPLPSYLIAFAVGDFDVVDGGRAGQRQTPISIVAPKGRGAEAAYAAANTGRILAATETYFGAPYPFPKLDLLGYPKSTFGGAMENAGLITYTARNLLARPDEISPGFEQRFTGTTAHEIAHMWFGDYVTMAWWDDLWLNESFASWMATNIVNELRPDWDRRSWQSRERYRAMEADRLESARRMRQPVTEIGEIRGAFNRIAYSKGESILTMFEQWLGPQKFREGVQRYMTRHAWGNATADDFFAALGDSDEGLVPAFRGFVERSGFPVLDIALDCTGAPSLQIAQQQFRPAGSVAAGAATWRFPACFDFGNRTQSRTQCVLVSEARQTVALDTNACPQWVIANRSGIGYFLPRLAAPLYAALPAASGILAAMDYEPLLADLGMLAHSGAVGYPTVLELAAAQAGNTVERSARRAFQIVGELPPAMIDPVNKARLAAWIRAEYGPRARKLGWLRKPGETAEVSRLREVALPLVAVRGEDARLSAEARRLAARWLRDRSALPVEVRKQVLRVAARTARADAPVLFEGFLSAARDATDPNAQEDVLSALGAFAQPALLTRALALLLDPSMDARDTNDLLQEALGNEATRLATLHWMRDNWAALAARAPPEQQGYWPGLVDNACTGEERAQFVAVFEARAAQHDGGVAAYRQSLEKIEHCLALRTAQQAPFNAWLARRK